MPGVQWKTCYHCTWCKMDKKDKATIKDEKNNEEQNEEMKCPSINTISDVVSMCLVPVKVKKKDSINEVQTHALLDSCSQGTYILGKLVKAVGPSGRPQIENTPVVQWQ